MLKVYIIEDDLEACNKLKTFAKNFDDIKIIGHTNSVSTALDAISIYNPDAIILDIELTNGSGNGLELLQKIKHLPDSKKPYTVVTTNTTNALLYNSLRKNDAGLIMCKHQQNYSELDVLNHLKIMKDSISEARHNTDKEEISYCISTKQILMQNIFSELTKIGIKTNVKGFEYLKSAIYFTINNPLQDMLNELSNIYDTETSKIEHSMRNAINTCWKNTPTCILEENYLGYISAKTGSPTTTQFITYYANKLKNKHMHLINNINI